MKFGELNKWLAAVGLMWLSVQAGVQQALPCPTSPTAGVSARSVAWTSSPFQAGRSRWAMVLRWCLGIDRVCASARHADPGPWDEEGTADCLGFRPLMEMTPAR
jgi:hypothetical protein